MGGCFPGSGNITPNAEYNFYVDVSALDLILAHFRKTKTKIELMTWELGLI